MEEEILKNPCDTLTKMLHAARTAGGGNPRASNSGATAIKRVS
jgi:hypothetical protein